ncbi:MAG TPA: addiction module protein [Polyangium sp.]|nr:addiction module protein [Polyangium sp.]
MGKAGFDVSKLSRDERLDLLDELWMSLGRDGEAFPLDERQRIELDKRLDDLELEEGEPMGLWWDEVVAMARAKRENTDF